MEEPMSVQCGTRLHESGLRDSRYGEIVVVRNEADQVRTSVYSTVGLNDCPAQSWQSLNPALVARELGATSVYLKGPQFWAVDEITVTGVGETISLCGLDARLISDTTTSLGTSTAASLHGPYREATVRHQTEWKLSSGQSLYKLISPDGRQYYLLAYSHVIDPGLNSRSLMTLGDRLELPIGWQYVVGSPVENLVLNADGGQARLLTDDLENSYLLRQRPASAPDQRRLSANMSSTAIQAAFSAI